MARDVTQRIDMDDTWSKPPLRGQEPTIQYSYGDESKPWYLVNLVNPKS